MDFNPRPREGSDNTNVSQRYGWRYFNPRPREGSDLTSDLIQVLNYFYFNPRPREGSDAIFTIEDPNHTEFQSTPP